MSRDLGLIGMPNARDIGGYRTADGLIVQSGVLYRGQASVKATVEDLAELARLELKQVIDLREPAEIDMFGLGEWPVTRVHLPIGDTANRLVAAFADEVFAEDVAVEMMLDMYRRFVSEDALREGFAAALARLTAPGGLPALIHCTAGKDRTGWLTAIVLSGLGVDRDTVIADYLVTNERFTTGRGAAGRNDLLTQWESAGRDTAAVIAVLDAREEYLVAAFEEAEKRFGSFDAFLFDGLNADLPSLRANLLTASPAGSR